MKEPTVGDKVWFIQYSRIASGTVIATHPKSTFGKAKLVVDSGTDFYLIDGDTPTFDNYAKALLHLGQKTQAEGTRLLSEAANYFKKAGIKLSETPETETAQ